MNIINNSIFAIVAVALYKKYNSFGDNVYISSGEVGLVKGPYLGEMGRGDCHVAVLGDDIVVQEIADDKNGFFISPTEPVTLDNGDFIIQIEVDHLLESIWYFHKFKKEPRNRFLIFLYYIIFSYNITYNFKNIFYENIYNKTFWNFWVKK